jgi:hypothetical protein
MGSSHVAIAWKGVVVFVLWGAGTQQESYEEDGHYGNPNHAKIVISILDNSPFCIQIIFY